MTRGAKIFSVLFFLQFAIVYFSFAQSVAPFLIGSAGNYSTGGGMSISSSVGEPVVSTFTTSAGTVKSLTQGFQQTFQLACPSAFTGFSISPLSPVCPGVNVTITPTLTGGSPPFTYSWSSGETTSAIVVAPTLTTAYTLTLVGCSMQNTQTVTVHPAIPTPTITAAANPVCEGAALSLTANSFTVANTYNWSYPGGGSFTGQNLNIPNIQSSASGTYTVVASNSTSGCASPAGTFSVAVSPIPTLSLTSTNALCSGDCNGSATVSIATGNPPFKYLWSTGETTSAIANLCAGPQTATINAGGCSITTSVTITQPNILAAGSISTTAPACSCNGTAAANPIGGTTPYTYAWAGPSISATTSNISGLCGGNYSLTITDKNGCAATSSANLTPSPGLTVNVSPPSTTICAGATTSIGANASGSVAYAWSPGGATTNVIAVSPTGLTTYTVIATNTITACSDTGFVQVFVNPKPIVAITGNTSICSGQGTTLTANASAGVTNYSWVPANVSSTISVGPLFSNTHYTVTVTDAQNCTAVDSVIVNITPVPTASISATPLSVCAGGVSTLTASGGSTYQWSPGGATTSVITTPPLSSSASFTVTVFNGSCSSSATETVNITAVNATISITNNDSALCAGESAVLTASTGNSYLWNPGGATTQSIPINPTTTTIYDVMITGSAGCSGTDTILVTVTSAPNATINNSGADTVCQFQSVSLTAGGGGTYQWVGGPAQANYNSTALVTGINTFSVTVSNGNCSSATSYTIFANPLPGISANATPNQICTGDTVTLSASANGGATPYTFGWTPGPLVGQTVLVAPAGNTTYSVGVIDANGCSNITTTPVTMNSITVDAGPNITICPGYTAILNAAVTGNVTNYLWSPGQFVNDATVQNPSATPDTSMLFIVNVSSGSCNAKDSLMVYTIRTPDCIIKIYSGITPNGDNDNNAWYIDGIQSYPDNKVVIFNRWGTRVWGASGYNNKDVVWKGTDPQGNILPDGTYYYFVELYDGEGGTIFSESSWVEVTR